jgi:HEAT repeat protein
VYIRNKAVYALGRIGDRRATQALLAQLPKVREARMLNNIAFALERLDPKAFFPAVQRLIQHKQAIIRLNAAFVLGDVRRPEGRPILESSLLDANDLVKTSSIAALGKLALPETLAKLEQFVKDRNPAVRQEAIYALHELSGKRRSDLLYRELFSSKWPAVKDRAAVALAKAGDARVRGHVLSCFEQRRCSLGSLESWLVWGKKKKRGGRLHRVW